MVSFRRRPGASAVAAEAMADMMADLMADVSVGTIPSSGLPFNRFSDTLVIAINPLLARITIEPGKCGGRPCIRGYRLRVRDVLELLAHGASWEEILTDYPFLEADDIRATLEFAAAQNDHVVLRAS